MDVDQKNMSLADIIKKDKSNKPAGGKGGPGSARSDRKKGKGGGRDRFGSGDKLTGKGGPQAKNGQNVMKARKTGNMIQKQKPFRSPRPNRVPLGGMNSGGNRQNFKSTGPQGGLQRKFSDERVNSRRPVRGGIDRGQGRPQQISKNQVRGNRSGGLVRQRGGLANARGGGAPRQALAAPKRQQRTLRIGDIKPQPKTKAYMLSQVRLKVRNFDEKQVTNDDLKKLFAKIGDLKVCRFDTNEFGQFLGSATVTYERQEDAKQAIVEYNGAFLDEKVLVVEYDMVNASQKPPAQVGNAMNKLSGGVLQVQRSNTMPVKGKTLKIHNR